MNNKRVTRAEQHHNQTYLVCGKKKRSKQKQLITQRNNHTYVNYSSFINIIVMLVVAILRVSETQCIYQYSVKFP